MKPILRPNKRLLLYAGPFLAGAVLLLAASAWLRAVERRLSAAQRQVDHALRTEAALASLERYLREAELAVRSYVVTGQRDRLIAYQAAARIAEGKWKELERMLSDEGDELQLRDALAPLVAARRQALAAFEKKDPERPDPASARVLIGRAGRTADDLARVISELHTVEAGRVAAAERARAELLRWIARIGTAQGVTGLLLLVSSSLVVGRLMRRGDRAEARADEYSGLMSLALHSISDGVVVADARGRAIVFNPAAERLLGGRPEQAADGHWDEVPNLFLPDCATPLPTEEMPLVKALQGRPTDGLEVCVLRGPGREPAHLVVSARPLHAPDGPLRGAVAVFSDMTTRRRADRELRRLNEELQSSVAKLSAANLELESFAHSLSHGLRGPLRSIDGFARLLGERLSGQDPETRRLVSVVQENAARMGRLIDDLLAYVDLGRRPVRPSKVDVGDLMSKAFEAATRSLEGPKPELELHPVPPASGDAEMLSEACRNLMHNAVKFSRTRPTPRVEAGAINERGKPIYYVRDNGVGFDMRYAHRLFGVFERLHGGDEFEGNGVGLAIVHRIITRHGGRIWAQAEPDAGASFYFTLGAE